MLLLSMLQIGPRSRSIQRVIPLTLIGKTDDKLALCAPSAPPIVLHDTVISAPAARAYRQPPTLDVLAEMKLADCGDRDGVDRSPGLGACQEHSCVDCAHDGFLFCLLTHAHSTPGRGRFAFSRVVPLAAYGLYAIDTALHSPSLRQLSGGPRSQSVPPAQTSL